MSLEVKVGPPQLAIHDGYTMLLTELDGRIDYPSDKGLYFFDTRMINSWAVYADGVEWELLNGGTPESFLACSYLTNGEIVTGNGTIAEQTLGLTLTRHVDGGMHEDLDVTNHAQTSVRFNLEIAQRSDFADIFEVKSGRIVRRGRITTEWSQKHCRLTTAYRNEHFSRAIAVSARNDDGTASYANGRITFALDLPPGGGWHACLSYDLTDGKQRYAAPAECCAERVASKPRKNARDWQRDVLKAESSNDNFTQLFRQATDDMAALRLPVAGDRGPAHVPAAGLPWFIALFGRDTLIASLQTALVYPEFARATLEVLGSLQATEIDDFRDAEPGKILHELRRGELAALKLIPQTPYYGSADVTPLYVIALHSAWRTTADRALLERHLPTAERCLQWIDEYGDRDGDGFQEYETRSSAGLANQSWKDSGIALVYPDGSLVKGPTATCELQGYVYAAWLAMAELYDALHNAERAERLRAKAALLHTRFNDAFWDDDTGFYAFALDGAKNKVRSVASNPGHCLWSGIVPPERAGRVVARLMRPDMWTGWGIRTLSSAHVAYNPYSYQLGAVWPHDNGLIAQGFKRYGYADEAAKIAHDVWSAGAFFVLDQLPELYAGLERGTAGFPVQYLGANVPQAWAAGSVFSLTDALLGLEADAPNQTLYVDPTLPAWLDDVTLRDLRVGTQTFDIAFRREGTRTRFDVLRGDATSVKLRTSAQTRRVASIS